MQIDLQQERKPKMGINRKTGIGTARDGKLAVTGANIVLFIFSAVFVVYQIVLSVIFGDKFFVDNIYLSIVINEIILIIIPVLIYCFIKKINIRETFRFNKFKPGQALMIVLIAAPAYFAASMLNNVVYYLLQLIGKIPAQQIPVPKNIPEYLLGLLIVAVLPGICEEMMHRGLMLRAYERRGSKKAVVITAIFFGLFHFDMTNLLGPIFLGLLIGYYVIRTNSIFAGMLAHFLNNAIAETMQFFWGDRSGEEYASLSAVELGQVVLMGLAGLIVVAALIAVFRRLTEGQAETVPPISSVKGDFSSIASHWPVIGLVLLYAGISILYILSIVYLKFTGAGG
ncbi:MAG: CPBP family intramembrane metalloprotease [Clostridiales bacterium]|nr:CPBP family intramembrane metalloprotease [Clostridiales bacterium]